MALSTIVRAVQGYSSGGEVNMVVVEGLLVTIALVVGGVVALALAARFFTARL